MITRAGVLMAGLLLVPGTAVAAATQGSGQHTRAPADAKAAAGATPDIVQTAAGGDAPGPHLRFRGSMCMCGHGPDEKQIEAAAKTRSQHPDAKGSGARHSNN